MISQIVIFLLLCNVSKCKISLAICFAFREYAPLSTFFSFCGICAFERRPAGFKTTYIIGHNYHGHYLHAEGLSVNNYVRENKVREVNVRE